jgi:hypothetical protein
MILPRQRSACWLSEKEGKNRRTNDEKLKGIPHRDANNDFPQKSGTVFFLPPKRAFFWRQKIFLFSAFDFLVQEKRRIFLCSLPGATFLVDNEVFFRRIGLSSAV